MATRHAGIIALTLLYAVVLGYYFHCLPNALLAGGIVALLLTVLEISPGKRSALYYGLLLGAANGVLLGILGHPPTHLLVPVGAVFGAFVVGIFGTVGRWAIGVGVTGVFLEIFFPQMIVDLLHLGVPVGRFFWVELLLFSVCGALIGQSRARAAERHRLVMHARDNRTAAGLPPHSQ